MLAISLVVLFLLLVGWLSESTRDGAEAVLRSAKSDISKAHSALSAEPHPSKEVKRALAFLSRWV